MSPTAGDRELPKGLQVRVEGPLTVRTYMNKDKVPAAGMTIRPRKVTLLARGGGGTSYEMEAGAEAPAAVSGEERREQVREMAGQ